MRNEKLPKIECIKSHRIYRREIEKNYICYECNEKEEYQTENYGKNNTHHSPIPAKSVISLQASSEIPLSSLNWNTL